MRKKCFYILLGLMTLVTYANAQDNNQRQNQEDNQQDNWEYNQEGNQSDARHDNGYQYQGADDNNNPGPGQPGASAGKFRHYFVGGNFIASFGDGGGALGINPSVGYSINQYVDVGIGLNAVYNYSKDYYNGGKWRTWNLGIAPFARVYPIDFLFFEASFEENLVSTRYVDKAGNKSDRQNDNAPSLIGAIGYTNRIFGRSSFFISVGMDFLNNENSPYRDHYYDQYGHLKTKASAIIRTGFNINLW